MRSLTKTVSCRQPKIRTIIKGHLTPRVVWIRWAHPPHSFSACSGNAVAMLPKGPVRPGIAPVEFDPDRQRLQRLCWCCAGDAGLDSALVGDLIKLPIDNLDLDPPATPDAKPAGYRRSYVHLVPLSQTLPPVEAEAAHRTKSTTCSIF
jgi:hypothetical protein